MSFAYLCAYTVTVMRVIGTCYLLMQVQSSRNHIIMKHSGVYCCFHSDLHVGDDVADLTIE